MKLIYEDEIQVCHETAFGGTTTSLKKCPHGINVWSNGWDLSLCKDCNQPERSKREDYKVTTINSNECPKIEMPIDKDILTKYKWDSIDAVL